MRGLVCLCLGVTLLGILAPSLRAQNIPVTRANYDLAAKWTGQKVGKLVFDSSVTPHWLEFSDRFWYAYSTSQGRKFFLVDPKAKSKKPLFDNAKMAAMLTKITLTPYDAAHLPIQTLKFIKKDTAFQFDLEYPKEAQILNGEKVTTVDEIGKQTEKEKEGQTPQEKAAKTKPLHFEYDLATNVLTLVPEYKVPL